MKRVISHMPVWIKICCIAFLGIALSAVFANVLAPYDPDATELLARSTPPVFMGGTMEPMNWDARF